MIELILAQQKDLPIITNLATTIWNQHYVSIIGKQQVDYMLQKMYSFESLVEQLTIKKHQFYMIKKQEDILGFLSVSSSDLDNFFLHKFYILEQQSNSGLGTEVFKTLINVINPKTLTLTVNRQNFKSINFYFKNGFKIKSVEDFDIGNGYVMNDFVMIKKF